MMEASQYFLEIPVMQAANHLRLTKDLSACGYDIWMSDHARQRAYGRSSLSPSRVYELIASRQAVCLNLGMRAVPITSSLTR
jgi:hypothetical protein